MLGDLSSRSLLETDSSERGQVIEREQIVNLPLNGRSYAEPGAPLHLASWNPTRTASARADAKARSTSTGCATRQQLSARDGVDNNAYGTSNQGFSNQVIQVSPDAIAEFKVQTNNYSAEYGAAAAR